MPLEFDCRECREPFVPNRDDITAGPAVYRVCPSCRETASYRGDEERPRVGRTNEALNDPAAAATGASS